MLHNRPDAQAMCRVALAVLLVAALQYQLEAQSLEAPPGMFKELNDEIVGEALLISGKQLFIDDFVIAELDGAQKTLHQPTKHPKNPLLVRDRSWEVSGPGYGTVIFDEEEQLFKLWYENYGQVGGAPSTSNLCYAVSTDGLHWEKPIINPEAGTNIAYPPSHAGFEASGIFKDVTEQNPQRRYKMLYASNPDGTSASLQTGAAFSPDGIHWAAAAENPLIPFSDTQGCPFWDQRRNRYIAYVRFGPPNTRIISRIESEDFIHWSPKVTVLKQSSLDEPLGTQFYQMAPLPYGDVYLGMICAYHGETLGSIPDDEPWVDRKNLQLVYSRNGVTWLRVGKQGAITVAEMAEDRDWKQAVLDAAFIPYGERDKDWDWGTISPLYMPEAIIVDDQIWFYYTGINAKNWWTHSGDPPALDPEAREPDKGVGLATLRIDGFVSVDAGEEGGTLTTRLLVFIGDALEVNANAAGGSITVEALDANGQVIDGFSRAQFDPITTDSVRHRLQWKGSSDVHPLQARPIRLKFYLQRAAMYSFTPRVVHEHYIPSYQ